MRLDESGERVDVRERPRSHNEQAHLRRYLWAAEKARGEILDAACGTGYGSAVLARAGHVVGIDYNADAVESARARVPDGLFVVGDLPALPFDDAWFDAVVSFETIEHIQDDQALVTEFARVLRAGGILLLSTPNRDRPGAQPNEFHIREYTLADLVSLLADAGFLKPEVFYQGGRHLDAAGRLALRFVARFPVLCRPGHWWDVMAHGHDAVMSAPEQSVDFFVLAAIRS